MKTKITILIVAFLTLSSFFSEEIYFGEASYYANKFQGRKTASGERFDQNLYTCAHRTFPFGTWLKVTNIETGISVNVRVNDRGPYSRNRLIDVSKIAAIELGMLKKGFVQVSIEVIEDPNISDEEIMNEEIVNEETIIPATDSLLKIIEEIEEID